MKSKMVAAVAGGIAGAVLMAGPAAAGLPPAANTFQLVTRGVSAYGTYDRMMSIPERPVPPIAVRGTLTVHRWGACAVAQMAYNGPTDAIAWRTVSRKCGWGRVEFRATSQFLRGGAQPQLRVCAGTSVARAEQSRFCAVHTPRAD